MLSASRDGGLDQFPEKLVDGRAGPRGLVGHHRVGVSGESENLRPLHPQARHFDGQGAVVELPRRCPRHGRLVHPASDLTVFQRGQQGLATGQDQGDQITAVVATRGGFRGGSTQLGGTESVQFARVGEHERRRLRRGVQILRESGRQARDSFVQVAESILAGRVEPSTGQHEVEVVALHQDAVHRGELLLLQSRMHGIDAGEQRTVQPDPIAVFGQSRCVLGFDLPQLGRGTGRQQVEEQVRRAGQQLPGPLQCDQGVLERRRGRVGGDRVDLGQLLRHSGVEGGPDVLCPDALERRQPERQGGPLRQRITGQRRNGVRGRHAIQSTTRLRVSVRHGVGPRLTAPAERSSDCDGTSRHVYRHHLMFKDVPSRQN